jgi:hypothetical protein
MNGMGGGFGGNMTGMGDGNEGASGGVHGKETSTQENVEKDAVDDDETTVDNGTSENGEDANWVMSMCIFICWDNNFVRDNWLLLVEFKTMIDDALLLLQLWKFDVQMRPAADEQQPRGGRPVLHVQFTSPVGVAFLHFRFALSVEVGSFLKM